ncbi:LuxR C-terminal-related transcriptional regulator, partial [Streptomyces violaceoruber]
LIVFSARCSRSPIARLHLAEKTIKNYVSSLLGKLGMQRRSQAAAFVARLEAENR